jgi:hypothetical protein
LVRGARRFSMSQCATSRCSLWSFWSSLFMPSISIGTCSISFSYFRLFIYLSISFFHLHIYYYFSYFYLSQECLCLMIRWRWEAFTSYATLGLPGIDLNRWWVSSWFFRLIICSRMTLEATISHCALCVVMFCDCSRFNWLVTWSTDAIAVFICFILPVSSFSWFACRSTMFVLIINLVSSQSWKQSLTWTNYLFVPNWCRHNMK